MKATRRDFIRITALSGSALVLGVGPLPKSTLRPAAAKPFRPGAWLRIDEDGSVTIVVGKSEMGQGVRTSLPMIVAEELDADWSRVVIEQAMPGPDFKRLGTGGSWSVGGSWKTLRVAGATAREMLLLAAASRWSVDRKSLKTDQGFVLHESSGRRIGYGELTAEAAKIAVPQNVALKDAKEFRIIGRRMPRRDGAAIVTGKAVYGIDARVPDMLFATVVRPPVVAGAVRRFDSTKAMHVAGVEAVVAIPTGVAVVGRNTWAALKGRTLLDVEFDAGTAGSFGSEEYIDHATRSLAESGVVMRAEPVAGAPAFPADARAVEATYVYPFYAHAPVEPMNCIADVRGGKASLWVPTQTPNSVQTAVAKELGLSPDDVEVHVTLLGGGFGRRLRGDYAIEAAQLSRKLGKPVQILWTRPDDMKDGHLQHASVHGMRAAIGSSGELLAWRHKKASRAVMSGDTLSEEDRKNLPALYRDSAWGSYDIPYLIPNLEVSYVNVDSPVRYGPWRSVYAPSCVFARESFFDEIAHAAKRDPLQMRLDLLAGPDEIKAGERKIQRHRLRRVLETVRDRAPWGRPLGSGRAQGVACSMYEGETCIAYVAEISLDSAKRFRVDRIVAAVECGPVVNPIGIEQQVEGGIVWAMAQLRNQITIRNGAVEQSTYRDFPVPRIDEIPKIEVHILPADGEQPFGIGEPPVPPAVPAILNAYFAASGIRVRRLPMGA